MKNWKRVLSILLVACLVFSLGACKQTTTEPKKEEQKEEGITPLLYKVTDEQGNVVWMFGSIHVGNEEFYPLPKYVQDAYEGADSLAVECDIMAFEKSMSAQTEALQTLLYLDGTTIKDHISQELYESAVNILEENDVYSEYLDYYYPSLWSNFITSAASEKVGADAQLGIDRYLLKKAKNNEKPIVEIESAKAQYSMLAGFTEPLQLLQLEMAVEEYQELETFETELKELMDIWAKGDEKAFAKLLAKETAFENEEEKALYEEYYNAMYTSRNIAMADFVVGKLAAKEEVFVCVGAAHVVGEGGMVELLREKGYTVEVVK